MSDAVERAKQAAFELSPAEWREVKREVEERFIRLFRAAVAEEALVLAEKMDMTPEGYVREWVARGRRNFASLPPWEKAYQDKGLIELAERLGYIEIGRGASAPVSLTGAGEALVAESAEPAATTAPSPR